MVTYLKFIAQLSDYICYNKTMKKYLVKYGVAGVIFNSTRQLLLFSKRIGYWPKNWVN